MSIVDTSPSLMIMSAFFLQQKKNQFQGRHREKISNKSTYPSHISLFLRHKYIIRVYFVIIGVLRKATYMCKLFWGWSPLLTLLDV